MEKQGTPSPFEIARDTNLTRLAHQLYGKAYALSKKNGYCWISNSLLSNWFGVSRRTAQRAIKSLEDAGYIQVELEHANRRKIYILSNGAVVTKMSPGVVSEMSLGSDKNVTRGVTKMSPPIYVLEREYTENKKEIYKEKSKKTKTPTVEADDLMAHYRELTGKRSAATEPIMDNLEYWLSTYTIEEIKTALENGLEDKFWSNKLTPLILLRRKNQNRESVDYIGQFLDKEPETEYVAKATDGKVFLTNAELDKALNSKTYGHRKRSSGELEIFPLANSG